MILWPKSSSFRRIRGVKQSFIEVLIIAKIFKGLDH